MKDIKVNPNRPYRKDHLKEEPFLRGMLQSRILKFIPVFGKQSYELQRFKPWRK